MDKVSGNRESDPSSLEIVNIAPDGDVVLDVTFETSKETLKAARKAAKPRPGQQAAQPVFKSRVRVGYRARISVLRQHSKYFDSLLGDTRFSEAKAIAVALDRLSLQNVAPGDASAESLPRVTIKEDDEATQAAGQEAVFGDLLRLLHGQEAVMTPVTMHYLATLAVLADRFNCTAAVARTLSAKLKLKWPVTKPAPQRDEGSSSLTRVVEETLRQKILVSWLLDQPIKMSTSTRELIIYGSRRWTMSDDEEMGAYSAAWWNLPDGLEGELQYRRGCILNTIASVQRHFLKKYMSRQRQCKLGYDSSASCDCYQLGELIKFLASHDLLFLSDFSPSSLDDNATDYAAVDVNQIITKLKQLSGYQIDKNHKNCGPRSEVLTIMDYIQGMLSSNIISISRTAWKKNRDLTTWDSADDTDKSQEERVFRFTRSISRDQRFRYEGTMGSERMAVALFTAEQWDWTPED